MIPDRSKISRAGLTAFAKRQRGGADADLDESEAKPEPKAEPKPEAKSETQPEPKADSKPDRRPDRPTEPDFRPDEAKTQPEMLPLMPAESWPDATPAPMRPVDLDRSRTETVTMPVRETLGRPPEMPTSTAPPPLALGTVEDPTHMPGPRDIPSGNPDDRAPAPGRVPAGDSRSMRRGNEFALVYRVGTYVISRFGVVGTRGQWRVVEYPTSTAASHSYAKECSRFVSEGFSDYRE